MDGYLSAALSKVNSGALPHGLSTALCNDSMKIVEEVRRLRLLQIKAQEGSLAAINRKLGLASTDSTLSQILNEAANSRTGKPKGMGPILPATLCSCHLAVHKISLCPTNGLALCLLLCHNYSIGSRGVVQ